MIGMKKPRPYLFLIIGLVLAVFVGMAQAAVCISRQASIWGQNTTWNCAPGFNNGPPGVGDSAVVNHAITLNTDTAVLSGLTVNAARTITANGNRAINLNGPLVNNGTITMTSGSNSRIVLASDSAWSGAGSIAVDYIDLGSKILSLAVGSTLTVRLSDATPLQNVGGFNNGATPNSTALVYLVGGAQSFAPSNLALPNLRVSGGSKTLSSGAPLAIYGGLTIDSGASFNSVSAINLAGNLTINGSLQPGDGVWTFNGSALQTISSATAFRSVVLNNAQGISLGGNMTIGDTSWGALTLTSGRVATGNYSVIIPRTCDSPWLTRTTGGWINGNLQLTAPAWGATCVFAVGDATNYAPIVFTYPWHAAPLGGTITGRSTGGDHPETISGTSGINSARSVNRYWTLTPASGANFYTYDATFQYCSATGGSECGVGDVDAAATPANFIVAEKVAAWSTLTPTAATTTTRTVSGLSTFGSFAIGEAGSGLTCLSDSFASGLNSTLWNVAGSGYTPQVVTSPTVPSSRLRLTDNVTNRSTFAQLKKWFPASGNKIVVEFDYFVYGGSGADGISMVLSDASVAPSPGGYGGSLGYANRSGINGFNGGWIGIGLDEFGNYPNSSEARRGYPAGYVPPSGAAVAAGFYKNSIAIRGSGVAQTSGYALLANTGTVSPVLTTTNASPHRYRITVDHSNNINALVTLERNSGSGYSTVVSTFDAKGTNSGQATVPANFLLSFTGSTGGSTNFHEITNVQVCATAVNPVGNSSPAANYECLDSTALPTWSTTARHPLYTKITDTAYRFDIVALKSDGTIENNFVAAGGNPKNVTVALFDDSASPSPACSAYGSPVASQVVTYVSGDAGRKTITSNFSHASAYSKLRCRVTDTNSTPTVYGCSTDTFAVRPQSFNSVASSASADGAGASTSATPAIKSGASFSLTAGTGKPGYGGTPQIDAAKIEWLGAPTGGRSAPGTGTLGGLFTTAASASNGNGAQGTAFTYSEVGYFRFQPQGVYDNTFTAASGDITNGDCTGDYSNALVGGKYGCFFGNTVVTSHFGRFIPDHFKVLTPTTFTAACAAGGFSYMDQVFSAGLNATLEAQNSGNTRTQNYSGGFANGAVALQLENANSGSSIASSRLNTVGTAAWAGGSYSYSADRFLRLTTGPDGPYDNLDIGLSVTDEAALPAASRPYLMVRDMDAANTSCTTDLTGLSTAAGVCSATRLVTGAKMRFGRLWLGNAYGSERSALSLPYETQYWNGLAFVKNTADNCTALTTANIGIGNYQNSVTSSNLPVSSVSAGVFASGAGTIRIAAPNAAGSVDVAVRSLALGMCPSSWAPTYPAGTATQLDYLRGKWCGTSFVKDPVARATFGIYSNNRQIYLREGF